MPTLTLALDALPQELFPFVMVFARFSAAIMLFPALSEAGINARARLTLALGVTLLSAPVLGGLLPPMPETMDGVLTLLIIEIAAGLVFGTLIRLMMAVLQIAGSIIAMQTGLGFAQNFDPTQGVQSALVGTFLAMFGIMMIFATDLHLALLLGLRESYTVFPAGAGFSVGDAAEMARRTVNSVFLIAVQISSPFLVFGLIFYLGIGVLSRLMPQVQVFFLAVPLNILAGFALLMMLFGTMMMWFLDAFKAQLILLTGG